jgi:glycosyltransferase involved in cell wall biosynthesis
VTRTRDYAVVVPALNESATIRDVVTRALAHAERVIVVDDGSTDGTAERLAGLPAIVLRNERNEGKAASLWRGASVALREPVRGIVTIDGDGQHDPDDIPRLVAAAERDRRAIVIGSRLHARDEIPKARYRANRFANFWIAWAAGCRIVDSQSGLRVYPREVFERLDVRHDPAASFVFESEVLIEAARTGLPILCVPVSVRYRAAARPSHFRPVADIARIAKMVAGKLLARGLALPSLVRSLR